VLLASVATAPATPCLKTNSPSDCFNNLASHLLSAELNLDLAGIQVYPTNQYTPAVHRLLQLTANLYDSTTNRADLSGYPYLPSVFRPLFRRDNGGDILIVGYREVQDAGMADPATAPAMVDLAEGASRSSIPLLGTPIDPNEQIEPMVYGVPLVIGAKKGFPNFNQFGLQNSITVVRRLDFHRLPGQPLYGTNQIYTLAISNSFGVQAWNSYTNDFSRPLKMIVEGDVFLSLTNEFGLIYRPDGLPLANDIAFYAATNLSDWPGFVSVRSIPPVSFTVPLLTNYLFVSNWVYLCDQNRFITNATADAMNYFPVPNWQLSVSERLRFILVDITANRIVDYVNLSSSEKPLNIMELMRKNARCDGDLPVTGDPDPGCLWCTNRAGNPTGIPAPDNPHLPTYGILNQMYICMGLPRMVSDSFWRGYNSSTVDKAEMIWLFLGRMFGDPSTLTDPSDLDFSTPFNPQRTIYQYISWEANDPLVHHTVPDLIDLFSATNVLQWDVNTANPVSSLSGRQSLANHYRPWGGNPLTSGDTTPSSKVNPAVKDPQVTCSDDWDFPSGEALSLSNLGRIHRGTPWQTVYLKSARVDGFTWQRWTGDTNGSSALVTMPTNDWRLVSLLGLMLNTNNPHQLLSINNPDTNAWLAVLDGLAVLTNSSPPLEFLMSSNSPQAVMLAAAILRMQSAQPAGHFLHLGDILATPELSLASPWLNTNNSRNSPSDEAYEMIPSQLLPRLREDSIGSLISVSNQTRVQFTGYDHYAYAVEASRDLVHWVTVGTKRPCYGIFTLPIPPRLNSGRIFYRSVLLPRSGERHHREKFLFYRHRPVFIDGDESRHTGRRQGHADEGAHE
jgi:hypothetical protein